MTDPTPEFDVGTRIEIHGPNMEEVMHGVIKAISPAIHGHRNRRDVTLDGIPGTHRFTTKHMRHETPTTTTTTTWYEPPPLPDPDSRPRFEPRFAARYITTPLSLADIDDLEERYALWDSSRDLFLPLDRSIGATEAREITEQLNKELGPHSAPPYIDQWEPVSRYIKGWKPA